MKYSLHCILYSAELNKQNNRATDSCVNAFRLARGPYDYDFPCLVHKLVYARDDEKARMVPAHTEMRTKRLMQIFF